MNNKINKSLVRLNRKKREVGELLILVSKENTLPQLLRILWGIHGDNSNKLDEMENPFIICIKRHKLPKLNWEETDNLKNSVIPKPIEFIVKNHSTQKILVPDGFTGECYWTFKGEIIPNLHKSFRK